MTNRLFTVFVAAMTMLTATLPLRALATETAETPVQTTVWVAPEGSDQAAGTVDAPLASLQAAFSRVRTLRQTVDASQLGEVHIVMRGGTYRLASTLQLTPADSGTPTSPTIVRAAEGEQVVVSGGALIQGWQDAGVVEGMPEVAQGNVWKSAAPTIDGQPLLFRQMWVGHNKMRRASTFDSQSLPRLISVDKSAGELTVPRIAQAFARPDEVEMTIIQDWVTNVMRVGSITNAGEQSVLTFKDPESSIEFKRPWPILRADASSSTNHHFYLSNAIELLNQPQEWYCDMTTGTLYYWPRSGEEQNSLEAVVPVLDTIVSIAGDGQEKVSDISFRDITFAHSSWLRPSLQGHVPLQAGQWLYDAYSDASSRAGNVAWVGRPAAAVSVSDAQSISFEGCHFRQTASTGIDFVKGTKQMTVRGCTFSDMGGSAILAGYFGDETFEAHEPYNPDRQDEVCDDITIDNNYIAHTATEDWGCLGICIGYASNVTISHNEIFDTPYSAISMGWGWTKDANCMHDNHITANFIHSFCNEMRDGGAIYTLSSQPSSSIEGNRIEDVGDPQNNPIMWAGMQHAQFDIYLDEGSDYFTVRNNWCERGEFSKNQNGSHNTWGANSSSVPATYKDAAGLEADYQHIKESVVDPDVAPFDSIKDNSNATLEYPTERVSGAPVTVLTDGEEYAMQCSNATLAKRNLYWEWGTYLRTRSDGKLDDVTFVAHKHQDGGRELWSFQITSETGKGKYMGCTNGANVQVTDNEQLWTATWTESDTDEGDGFVLLMAGDTPGEGHEMTMNGSADWVTCYSDGTTDDKTPATTHWSFFRTSDLNAGDVAEYNKANLLLYQYLIEASQMYNRGITSIAEALNAGKAVYNDPGNTTEQVLGAVTDIQDAIKASVSDYEEGVAATYGILNPSFENLSNQPSEGANSVPFGWTLTKDGTVVTDPVDWAWCGCNKDVNYGDGSYIWGVWHWGSYGNMELSQTLSNMPNGRWRLTARLMNNHTEAGNLARVFAGNNSMLAGTEADYSQLPEGENCSFSGEWSSDDRDLGHVVTVEVEVTDGTLTFGARTNGFFKVDDFRLTYLGPVATAIAPVNPVARPVGQAYTLTGRKAQANARGIVIVDGVKRMQR